MGEVCEEVSVELALGQTISRTRSSYSSKET